MSIKKVDFLRHATIEILAHMISIRRNIINPTKKKQEIIVWMHMIDLFVRKEKIMSQIMMPIIVTNNISKRKYISYVEA